MTMFDILVPLCALLVAGAGIVALKRSEKSLDSRQRGHHPAE